MCREIFIPDEGRMFVKLDYSGQENVLQAHFAVGENGKRIRAMYIENPRLDEHSYVTNVSGLGELYGDNLGRKYAKNLRFGKSYGMQLLSIMRNFGWDEETAKEVENLVVTASPWVYETMDILQDMLKGEGQFRGRARPYIKTLAGRIIRMHNKNDAYKFYNYLIQGSASDMIKAAMIKLWKTRTVDRLLLTVHDENCLDVSKDEEGFKRVDEMRIIMENAIKLKIPIICDPEVGSDWAHVEGQKKGEDKYPVETVIDMCRRVTKKKKIAERNFDDVDEYVTSHYALDDEEEED
jgi:DNA polymerase-1